MESLSKSQRKREFKYLPEGETSPNITTTPNYAQHAAKRALVTISSKAYETPKLKKPDETPKVSTFIQNHPGNRSPKYTSGDSYNVFRNSQVTEGIFDLYNTLSANEKKEDRRKNNFILKNY